MMRIKTRQFFTYLVFVVCMILFISMYLMMNNIEEPEQQMKEDTEKILLVRFKESIMKLKDQLDGNEAKIEELKDLLSKLNANKAVKDIASIDQILGVFHHNTDVSLSKLPKTACPLNKVGFSDADIKMSELFEKLPFDNPDGGVWKQGYPIEYPESQWNKTNKLLVFVVPHSHNDPGWIKTFEQYYQDQTSHILDNVLSKLEEFPRMRFIYAEISFFSMWWKTLSDSKRKRVAKLLNENKLELVTGGWVMTDEANSHYFAMLDQMIEGNQWLLNEIGYVPKNGWAIDPFGHSPTMAYLLKNMPFDNMLIQRTHYSIKKEFSKKHQLEFLWRQGWDQDGATDMFCHMMPFYSYDVPHTCGPDPKICCQFDFRRNYGKYSCPWKIQPVPINAINVKERAKMLLDQYRKKSMLYKNNVVLIPLGDDFRYDTENEWSLQYENYVQLFDHMNSQADWHVEAKFATLSEYFQALRKNVGSRSLHDVYPTLSGDFFVYADRDQHYWSGYFTSRPFYKKLDRELEYHQRLSEILLSLALAESRAVNSREIEKSNLATLVVKARRYLGLFQHHDGITGTAKDHVVNDYGIKMLTSIQSLKHVILSSSQFLLLKSKENFKHTNSTVFELDEKRPNHFDVPIQNVIDLSLGERYVYFYNSLPQTRTTLVTFPVTSAHVEVKDSEGNVKMSQVNPIWEDTLTFALSTTNFKLSFVAEVPPLGFSKFVLSSVRPGANDLHHLAKVKVFNVKVDKSSLSPFDLDVEDTSDSEQTSFIENSDAKIVISKETGLFQKYVDKKLNEEQKMEVTFVKYGTEKGTERSGAYLFLPGGPAQTLQAKMPDLRITAGPLFSEATTKLPLVVHTIKLSNPQSGISGASMDVTNMVDIRGESNTEVAMRIKTDVTDPDGYFYTDLNGFQVVKRKFFSKLPLQANFYPMTAMAYLENSVSRFTLLTAQSLGAASLQPGWLEVMQDRRLNQDDNRGLEQGVLDNRKTPNRFRMLFERRPEADHSSDPLGFFTLKSHYASADLLHPLFRLAVNIWTDVPNKGQKVSDADLADSYSPLTESLPCDIHLVNLRVMVDRGGENNGLDLFVTPSRQTAAILHRLAFDCDFVAQDIGAQCSQKQVAFQNLFSKFSVENWKRKSFNFVEDIPTTEKEIPPMEVRVYSFELVGSGGNN